MRTEATSFVIRDADYADIELLCEMGGSTFIEAYAAQNDPENMRLYLARHFTAGAIKEEMDEVGARFFILECDKFPVGYARTRQAEFVAQLEGTSYAELARLYVLQSHHGLGLGKALLHHCMNFLKAGEFRVIWLGVWKENRKAIRFYEKAGFRIFGEHIFTFGNEDQSDWIMRYDFDQTGQGVND